MAVYERFAKSEERVLCHHKVSPTVSERHTIIEDCHGMLYNSSNMAADDEYHHGSWPKKTTTTTTRPPLPPPSHQGQYYPQANMGNRHQYYEIPEDQIKGPVVTTTNYSESTHHDYQRQMMKRPVNVQMKKPTTKAVLTSTEAVQLYGGVLITTKKHSRSN